MKDSEGSYAAPMHWIVQQNTMMIRYHIQANLTYWYIKIAKKIQLVED